MDANAKLELARAILDTHKTREASYQKEQHGYAIDYFAAARRAVADPELRPIVTSLLIAGYCEIYEWAEKIVKDSRRAKRGR